MQKLIEKVAEEVISFLEQRDNLVLVIHCTDNEVGMILKIIDDVEKARKSEFFFKFADDFHMLRPYIDVTIEKLRLQHRIASETVEEEGLPSIPDVPKELSDETKNPINRLGEAIQYTRSLRPPELKSNITWVLFPMQVTNNEEYHDLISKFSPKAGLTDNMQGLRIIFRGEPLDEKEESPFKNLLRVKSYRVDMGPDAIQKSLLESTEDETLSNDERAQSLLQYAMIASAHQRYDEAWDHLKYLLGYYQGTKNSTMQAIVINAAGDIRRKKGELKEAIGTYETAVTPAIASNTAIILLTVTNNLASTEFDDKNYEKAEQYYEQVVLLSEKVLDLEGKVNALKRQSECADFLEADDRIIAPLIHALQTTKASDMDEEKMEVLERLKDKESLLKPDVHAEVKKEVAAL